MGGWVVGPRKGQKHADVVYGWSLSNILTSSSKGAKTKEVFHEIKI